MPGWLVENCSLIVLEPDAMVVIIAGDSVDREDGETHLCVLEGGASRFPIAPLEQHIEFTLILDLTPAGTHVRHALSLSLGLPHHCAWEVALCISDVRCRSSVCKRPHGEVVLVVLEFEVGQGQLTRIDSRDDLIDLPLGEPLLEDSVLGGRLLLLGLTPRRSLSDLVGHLTQI